MRLIDADLFIETLNKVVEGHGSEAWRKIAETMVFMIETQCELIGVLKTPWIPCSERLPEEYQAVLATLNNGELTYAWRFDVDEWVICEGDRNATTDDILAWMPMPEPYKGEQNGKD